MRRFLAMPLALGLLAAAASAQTPNPASPTWQRVIETERHRGEVKDMVIADNGDIIVAGFLPGKRGLYDGWAARFDMSGKQVWSTLIGDRERDESLSVALGRDGSVFVAGWTDVPTLCARGWVAKLTAGGDTEWFAKIDLPDRVAIFHLFPMPDGGAIAVGHHGIREDGLDRVLAIRLQSDGKTGWMFDPASEEPVPAMPRLTSIIPAWPQTAGSLLPNGDLEVRGPTSGKKSCVVLDVETGTPRDGGCKPDGMDGNRNGERVGAFFGGATRLNYLGDAVFQRFDTSGKQVWERVLQTPVGDGIEHIAPTLDGGVVGAGFELDSDQVGFDNWNGLLVKLDADGNVVWRRKLGGSKRDELRNVAVLNDGSIVAAGYTGSQGAYEWFPWILHLNANGELEGEAKAELESRQK